MEFDELPLSEQERIRRILRETNNLAFGYAVPLMIAAPPSAGGALNHGSAIVSRFGDDFALLTADHVVREWYERAATDPSVVLHLAAPTGSLTFTTEQRLLFFDREADIAALWLTRQEAESTGTWIYEPTKWPPDPPMLNEMVYVAGFPVEGRISLSPKRVEFRAFNLATPVSRVADKNFKCLFEREHWVSESHVSIDMAPHVLGGVSGGPVFAQRGLDFVLVGTVAEFEQSLDLLIVGLWSHIPESRFHRS